MVGRHEGSCSRDTSQRHVAATKICVCTHMKMLRGRVSGTCCYSNCVTPILGTFCLRDKLHGVQLIELHRTRRGDKTLQGCHDPSCGRLCNMSLQQNRYLSQSETTTRVLCALCARVSKESDRYLYDYKLVNFPLPIRIRLRWPPFYFKQFSASKHAGHYHNAHSVYTNGRVAATYPWDMSPQHFHVCAN